MNNYDAYITGFYDPTSPINQIEEEPTEPHTYTEFLENELEAMYFESFFKDFKDTVNQIHLSWKRIAEIEQNNSLLPFDSDEQQELILLKKKLTLLIEML